MSKKAKDTFSVRVPSKGHALSLLAGCFIISAGLRAGEVVAALPANTDDGFGNPVPTMTKKMHEDKEPLNEMKGPAELMAELRRQRDALQERESEMAAREQELKALEQRLEKRLEDIANAREKLAETAKLVDDAAGKDVRKLASMYQQMKPKRAGEIFNEMAPSFAAGFLAEMQAESAAQIMANMEANKAYAVSILLAGRNVEMPKSESQSQ